MKSRHFFFLGWVWWLICHCVFVTHAQVVISEFMASNGRTLADEDGDYPDWLEIYNGTPDSISLDGWYLTDSPSFTQKWKLPSVNVSAKDFLLIFASGKNRAVAGAPLHTSFNLSASGEYLALVKPDGVTIASAFSPEFPEQQKDISYGIGQKITTNVFLSSTSGARFLVPTDGTVDGNWMLSSFSDSDWTTATASIGYETSVPGFLVQNFKANVLVDSLTTALNVATNASRQTRVNVENSSVVNYYGTGGDGHYSNNRAFPGSVMGQDVDDFVVEATATVKIPFAGSWTFGVNSDDGFGLKIGSNEVSFPTPRGPLDTLATFNLSVAGDYPLRLVFYERGGGAGLELFAAQGALLSWNSSGFRLVGDTLNGGLEVKSTAVGGGGSESLRPLIGTDVQTRMKGRNSTVYLRMPFVVSNPPVLESLRLQVHYDGGFVAFLNGTEVARRNAPSVAAWNSAAAAPRPNAQVLAMEEINLYQNLALLRSEGKILAVQGLNESSDDTDYLLSVGLVELQVVGLPDQYFKSPTPGKVNGTGSLAFVADTKFSHARGFYDTPFAVAISCVTVAASIRYTTNGIPPTLTTGFVYSGPVPISGTSGRVRLRIASELGRQYFLQRAATLSSPGGWTLRRRPELVELS